MARYLIKTTKVLELNMEVPKYFKINNFNYMMLNHDEVLVVKPLFESSLFAYPEIRVDMVRYLADFWAKNSLDPMTESEFRQVYTDASLEIEKLMN
jgi:hypothetical protein